LQVSDVHGTVVDGRQQISKLLLLFQNDSRPLLSKRNYKKDICPQNQKDPLLVVEVDADFPCRHSIIVRTVSNKNLCMHTAFYKYIMSMLPVTSHVPA
jgi:hypothetical protein